MLRLDAQAGDIHSDAFPDAWDKSTPHSSRRRVAAPGLEKRCGLHGGNGDGAAVHHERNHGNAMQCADRRAPVTQRCRAIHRSTAAAMHRLPRERRTEAKPPLRMPKYTIARHAGRAMVKMAMRSGRGVAPGKTYLSRVTPFPSAQGHRRPHCSMMSFHG